MQTMRIIKQLPIRQWRRFSVTSSCSQNVQGQAQIENLTIPPPSTVDKPLSPKIEKLVNEISNLTLIEVSELSGGLKKHLNLPDAPAFPIGGMPMGAAAPVEDEDAAPQKIKSSYTVKLMKFDEKQKVPLIKEVKSLIEGMNLVQAKKFVESAPAVLKADISKEEAEKLKEAIVKVGEKLRSIKTGRSLGLMYESI